MWSKECGATLILLLIISGLFDVSGDQYYFYYLVFYEYLAYLLTENDEKLSCLAKDFKQSRALKFRLWKG